MANTMSMADLVASLKASLHDAANVFAAEGAEPDAAFERFLLQALPDMQLKRPVTKLGQVTLVAGTASYLVFEPDFAALKVDLWSDTAKLPRPWQPGYPGALPRDGGARGGVAD
ncbi:hypothetical protein LP416_27860 [Polaromonas sp. P2-4]|nr:hypothetical protein LP416_27860 [Polaromonas sp. P2-4]